MYIHIYVYLIVAVFIKVQRRGLHQKTQLVKPAPSASSKFEAGADEMQCKYMIQKQCICTDTIANCVDGDIHIAITTDLRMRGALPLLTKGLLINRRFRISNQQ